MKKFLLRLDDASDYMNLENWEKIEGILDEFSIKPIFGIIPQNKDPEMLSAYEYNPCFWELVRVWISKGWIAALHGYEHKYLTEDGGINPVHKRSEFAGLPYEEQAEKVKTGYLILKEHGIEPEIFFAPSHTFDVNTLKALFKETPIRVISDTIANDIYYKAPFYFIPQQSGIARNLPFETVTFCYHPNVMKSEDFENLRIFLKKNKDKAIVYNREVLKERRRSGYDMLLKKIYFMRRK